MPSSHTKAIDTALRSVTQNDKLTIRVSGTCMTPLISDGDRIQVSQKRLYFPGDIIVKRDGLGKLITHRLIGCYPRKGKLLYITRADNAISADGAVPASQIIGKLCGGECVADAYDIPLKTRLKSLGQFASFVGKRLLKKTLREH